MKQESRRTEKGWEARKEIWGNERGKGGEGSEIEKEVRLNFVVWIRRGEEMMKTELWSN